MIESARRAVWISGIKVHGVVQSLNELNLILHLFGENLKVWLSVGVVAKLEDVVQICGADDLLRPSPRLHDPIDDLFVCSNLFQNPRSKHSRVTCEFPCLNCDGATPTRKLLTCLHTLLILTNADGYKRNSENTGALLPRWDGAG